jgi:SAM-dependent methyltransferase
VIQKDAGEPSTVLELGAGYCDFINQFPAERKVAFDLNPEMRKFAAPDVDLRIRDAVLLPGIDDGSVDLVFASNFLEHLEVEQVHLMLSAIERVLRPGGRFILIQPNFRLCAAHYFDDPTHKTIFSDKNIITCLTAHNLGVKKAVPGFMPFSMKSSLPKWPFLVRLYLLSPVKPFAAQMYIVAERR